MFLLRHMHVTTKGIFLVLGRVFSWHIHKNKVESMESLSNQFNIYINIEYTDSTDVIITD